MCRFAEEKKILREFYKRRRAEIKSREKDALIARRFFSSDFFKKYHSFFVYLSAPSEANTAEIVSGLLAANKSVCVPYVSGREMKSVPYSDRLIKGAFGIMQPLCGEETTCAVALVPLLAADRQGGRLGYGGGYYDRYLKEHAGVLRVGLGYDGQLADKLPCEETDMPLDALITEKETLLFSPRVIIK